MDNAGFYVLGAFAIATGFYAAYHRNYLMLTGAITAALAHAGLLFGDQLLSMRRDRPTAEPPTIELDTFELPPKVTPLEDPQPPVDIDAQEQLEFQPAPPVSAELLGAPRPDAFSQQLQPPLPDGVMPDPGAIRIPSRPPSPGRGGPITVVITDLKVKPRPTYQVQPIYPPELKRDGITGTVVLAFIVDANGTARDITVVSADHPGFIQAATQALQKWRFSPGKFKGQAVHTRNVQQSIRFSLNEN